MKKKPDLSTHHLQAACLTVLMCILFCTANAATFTVTNTNDAGTGSLRKAITDANASATGLPHNINFAITPLDGSVKTITILSDLPQITRAVNINGYTQNGAVQNAIGTSRAIRVELNGNNLSTASKAVLEFSPTATGSSVSGLAIYNLSINQAAIKGTGPAFPSMHIWGNYFGTLADGSASTATLIRSYAVIFGDSDPGTLSDLFIGTNGDNINDANEGNIIANTIVSSGETGGGDGIRIQGPPGITRTMILSNVRIAGNFFGLERDGSTVAAIGQGAVGTSGCAITIHRVEGTDFVIGSNGDGISDGAERNIISGCERYGVDIEAVEGCSIAGNYIGTDKTGMLSRPNGSTDALYPGVFVTNKADGEVAKDISIGFNDAIHSSSAAANVRNVIAGNNGRGVVIQSLTTLTTSRTNNVVIAGNYIGVDATGNTALANGTGIITINGGSGVHFINVINCRIGTDADGDDDVLERNIISGNKGAGITISSPLMPSEGNIVTGNYIGVGANGTTAIGNGHAGVFLSHTNGINNNRIGSNDDATNDASEANFIAYNGSGIEATYKSGIAFIKQSGATGTAIGNRFSRNIYYYNAGLAIDLINDPSVSGVTPNDGVTTAGAPNLLVDYPVITGFSLSGTTMSVTGYVSTCNGSENLPGTSIPGAKRIQFYKLSDDGNQNGAITDGGCSRIAAHGEGVQYLGAITGVVNSFNTTFTLAAGATFAAGDSLTAIAIDANGNTSEFGVHAISIIKAVNDTFQATAGGTTAALTNNDTLNGNTPVIGTVSGQIDISNGDVSGNPPQLTLNTTTGVLAVVPGTPSGIYQYRYIICENATLLPNCDTAISFVHVLNEIEAVDDNFGTITAGTTTVATVLNNDSLNNVVVDLSKVTMAAIGTLPTGVILDPSGTVTIDAGVTSGPVSFQYSICEIGASPANCDTATISLNVLNEIEAIDDDFGNITAGTTTVATVLTNDSINDVVVNLSKVTMTAIGTLPTGVILDPSGTVTIDAGVTSGPVSFQYSICEIGASPANCDTATILLNVLNEIEAIDDDFGTITAGNTTTTVLGNDSLNGIAVNPADVTVSGIGTLPMGITLNSDGAVTIDAGVAIGSYTFDYQICENNTSIDNCDTATVTFLIDKATPVNLLYFDVKKSNNTALLNWATVSEYLNRGFEVLHSMDAVNWKVLSFVASTAEDGNSTMILNYSFDHTQPFSGINYYRLKQIDIDGRYTYTTVRQVAFDGAEDIKIFPNPAQDYIYIDGLRGDEVIIVMDLNSKKMMQLEAGTTKCKLNISKIISGTYYTNISRDGKMISTHKIQVLK